MTAEPEQLSLIDFIVQSEAEGESGDEVDLVDAVIQSCGGDARVAVRELLLDADFLRDQLYIASRLMSSGMGRGWRPRYERV